MPKKQYTVIFETPDQSRKLEFVIQPDMSLIKAKQYAQDYRMQATGEEAWIKSPNTHIWLIADNNGEGWHPYYVWEGNPQPWSDEEWGTYFR
jgi:hypothetical protein